MPPRILRQITQLTAAKLTRAQVDEMRRGGVTGVEIIAGDPISEVQNPQADLFGALDRFRVVHPEMPVLAAGFTCDLLSLESTLAIMQPMLAGCAARNVKYLNLAGAPAIAAGVSADSRRPGKTSTLLGYAEAAHTVYTALRDLRHTIEASGVAVNVDVARHGLFLSPLEMRQMIDAINSWAIGACVDVPHISTFSRPADWIATLGRRLKAVRVNDRDPALTQLVLARPGDDSVPHAVIIL